MSDYEPDFVYLVPVPYKKKEVFYETILKVPARVRGAILLDDDKKEEIEFTMVSPAGRYMYHNTTSQDIFDFNVTEAGTYVLTFNNRYSNSELRVTYTMNTGQNPILKKEDLTLAEEKVQKLNDFMKKYSLQLKMRHNVHSDRYKSI